MKYRALALAGVLFLASGASTPTIRPTTTFAVPQNIDCTVDNPFACSAPEGVAFDDRTGYFYVSDALHGKVMRGKLGRPGLELWLETGGDTNGLHLDRHGRLVIAGGGSGQVLVYDTTSRALIHRFQTGSGFLNDLAFDRDGNIYVTDSDESVVWRIRRSGQVEEFITVTGNVPGQFNLNGIVSSPDGRFLYTINHYTGVLYRIDISARTSAEVTVTGADLRSGDGLLMLGDRLLVVTPERNSIVSLRLSPDGRGARGVGEFSDSTFKYPTTVALARDRLLVPNSQFHMFWGVPIELPFTVSGVPVERLFR